MTEDLFTAIDAESWLTQRLKDHGCDPYSGGPNPEYRDRLRAAILDNGMQRVIVGRHAGKPENYAQSFERLYGEPLEAKAVKKKTAKERA